MYFRNLNEPLPGVPVTLAPAAARTATGTGTPVAVEAAHTLRVSLAITAVSGGTPSMTAILEHSEDGSTWVTHSSFTAATATGTQRKVISGLDRLVRCSWTITGTTPSFTFSVAGELV